MEYKIINVDETKESESPNNRYNVSFIINSVSCLPIIGFFVWISNFNQFDLQPNWLQLLIIFCWLLFTTVVFADTHCNDDYKPGHTCLWWITMITLYFAMAWIDHWLTNIISIIILLPIISGLMELFTSITTYVYNINFVQLIKEHCCCCKKTRKVIYHR